MTPQMLIPRVVVEFQFLQDISSINYSFHLKIIDLFYRFIFIKKYINENKILFLLDKFC